MNIPFGDNLACPNCGGKSGYHNWPCSGALPYTPAFPPQYTPNPPGVRFGECVPAKLVTEDDVRRIIREEIALWMATMYDIAKKETKPS